MVAALTQFVGSNQVLSFVEDYRSPFQSSSDWFRLLNRCRKEDLIPVTKSRSSTAPHQNQFCKEKQVLALAAVCDIKGVHVDLSSRKRLNQERRIRKIIVGCRQGEQQSAIVIIRTQRASKYQYPSFGRPIAVHVDRGR